MRVHAEFQRDLEKLLNKHSMDTYCEAHDFVLAGYLTEHLESLAKLNRWKRSLTGARNNNLSAAE